MTSPFYIGQPVNILYLEQRDPSRHLTVTDIIGPVGAAMITTQDGLGHSRRWTEKDLCAASGIDLPNGEPVARYAPLPQPKVAETPPKVHAAKIPPTPPDDF